MPGTNFFDVICTDVGGIVDFSSIAGLGNLADLAIRCLEDPIHRVDKE